MNRDEFANLLTDFIFKSNELDDTLLGVQNEGDGLIKVILKDRTEWNVNIIKM